MAVTLRNPHSVLATLDCRPKDILQIAAPQSASDAWGRVVRVAKERGVKVVAPHRGADQPRGRQDRGSDGGRERESSLEATIKEKISLSPEELFAGASQRKEGKGLWLALDCLQDPHNVGAIFRAASFFGVQGILMTEERSAPLSGTAYDVASGGVEYVPYTLQTNLQRGFEVAKENGLWILGASEHAKTDLSSVGPDRPWLLVLGNEEKGMRRLTEESCDMICKIAPRFGHQGSGVTSLNVSVATGILISHLTQK